MKTKKVRVVYTT